MSGDEDARVFLIRLDVDRGDLHRGTHSDVAVCLTTGSCGDRAPEMQVLLSVVSAGQFQVEGGVACMPDCGGRHPVRAIALSDGHGCVRQVYP